MFSLKTSIWPLLFSGPFCSEGCIPPRKTFCEVRREGPSSHAPAHQWVLSGAAGASEQKAPPEKIDLLKTWKGEPGKNNCSRGTFQQVNPWPVLWTDPGQGRLRVGGRMPGKAVPGLGRTLSCQCIALGFWPVSSREGGFLCHSPGSQQLEDAGELSEHQRGWILTFLSKKMSPLGGRKETQYMCKNTTRGCPTVPLPGTGRGKSHPSITVTSFSFWESGWGCSSQRVSFS